MGNLRIRLKLKRAPRNTRLDLEIIKSDQEMTMIGYTVTVHHRNNAIEKISGLDEQW